MWNESHTLSRRGFLTAAAGGVALSLLPAAPPRRAAAATTAAATTAALACWGDSLTYGAGGGGVTYPDLLAARFGVTVYNGGVIGERSSGVAARQGGRLPVVSVPAPFGEPLPPRTFRVNLDQALPWYERTMVIQEEGTLHGNLGGVPGILNKQGDYRNEFTPYYFTRDNGADRPPPGTFSTDTGVEYEGVDQIIWCGHNDLRLIDAPNVPPGLGAPAQDLVWDNLAKMAAYAEGAAGPDRYLVLSLLNGKGAGNGRTTTGRPTEYYENVVMSLNPRLAAELGPAHYLDVRTWLVQEALAYGGLEPTAQDLRDIEEDIPPSSLTVPSNTDSHLNALGYTLLARYLGDRLVQLGWYPANG